MSKYWPSAADFTKDVHRHFKDRQDLLGAVLATWRGRAYRRHPQGDPRRAGEAFAACNTCNPSSHASHAAQGHLQLAVRDWARHEPAAAAVVEGSSSTTRLECTRRLFLACGLDAEEAASRSLLLYAYVFGQSLIARICFAPDTAALRARIAERTTVE